MLLGELVKKFPLTTPAQLKAAPAPSVKTEPETTQQNDKEKQENTQDKSGKPPEKKPRIH